MKSLLLAFSILLAGTCSQSIAENKAYDPHWQPGDIFRVQYSFKQFRELKQPTQPPPISTTVTYTYTVLSVSNGAATIEAAPDQGGYSSWLLTFDATNMVLLSVQEKFSVVGNPVSPPSAIKYFNPFFFNPSVHDAWMANVNQYNRIILHDFLKIPEIDVDEARQIHSNGASTPDFTQKVTFARSSVTAVLSRTDPTTSLLQRTTITWRAGAKWWNTAMMTLGSEVVVSAKLL